MLDHKVEYFITVVEEGSFSAAARKLYLSQPALSKQIGILEKELGFLLFSRDGYRPVLTERGRRFYDGVLPLVNSYGDLVTELAREEKRNLRIAFTGAYEQRYAIQVMNELKKEGMFAEMSFAKSSFGDMVPKLLSKEVDLCFGISSSLKGEEKVDYQILFPHEICVICSFDHPFASLSEVTPAQLEGEKVVSLSEKFGPHYYRAFMDSCKQDGVRFTFAKPADSLDELVSEVAIGNGIAIVSKEVVRTTEVKAVPLVNSAHKENAVVGYLKKNEDWILPIVEQIKEKVHDHE